MGKRRKREQDQWECAQKDSRRMRYLSWLALGAIGISIGIFATPHRPSRTSIEKIVEDTGTVHKTVHNGVTTPSAEPYQPVHADPEAELYICAFGHPPNIADLDAAVVEGFDEWKTQRVIATFTALHRSGIRDILCEGLTQEDVANIAQHGVESNGVHSYQIYLLPILHHLTTTGWTLHPGEESSIEHTLDLHEEHIAAISQRWRELGNGELDVALQKYGLSPPPTVVEDISQRITAGRNAEVRAYLESSEGRQYYGLLYHDRNRVFWRRVQDLRGGSKPFVFFGGSSHGAFIERRSIEENVPYALFVEDMVFFAAQRNPDWEEFIRGLCSVKLTLRQ